MCREYDINQPQDPAQEYTFLPSSSKSRFTAADPLSIYATSFAFMPMTFDLGPTTVHVLCANGDLYFMGPIIPLHASVPLRWLHAAKVVADREGGLKAQWVDNLFKQVKAEEDRKRLDRELGLTTSRRASHSGLKPPGDIADKTTAVDIPEDSNAETVRLHPPHLTSSGGPGPGHHRPVLRQGPVIYDPVPEEVGAAEYGEDVASDLMLFQSKKLGGETVVAIAWAGGRVDLGLVLDPPQPRWLSSKVST